MKGHTVSAYVVLPGDHLRPFDRWLTVAHVKRRPDGAVQLSFVEQIEPLLFDSQAQLLVWR